MEARIIHNVCMHFILSIGPLLVMLRLSLVQIIRSSSLSYSESIFRILLQILTALILRHSYSFFLIYKMVHFPISGILESIKYHISCSNSKPAFSLRGSTTIIYNHHCHFLVHSWNKEKKRRNRGGSWSNTSPYITRQELKGRTTYVEKFSKKK